MCLLFAMILQDATSQRELKEIVLDTDLIVVGGGLAGVCCALTAARAGSRVILVQDRPVLGGNASSEVRLWTLGATSHMGNNNRWSREGGIVDELLVENLWRNPEGNALIFDTILLEKVVEEPNISLLLNTAVFEVQKEGDRVESVRAFCSQNSTMHRLRAPLFCDASGDGIVAFTAGAAFRMGAEARDEFGEKFAPSQEYGELLGHSLYFYSRDTGKPVRYVAPSFALKDITEIPRFRTFNSRLYGCNLWWIEYGGRLDTVHGTEQIKWELWRVVYGVWDYIKNSGKFPDAENLTLDWVGTIPGKRESRRFEGDYLLKQQDVVEQTDFPSAVAYGGWSLDLHPADGVFSPKPGCNQWHSQGVYSIPYECYYSRNVANLFLAGRLISATHVAFASSRVMQTCAHGAQAVGMAANLCRENDLLPREVGQAPYLAELQKRLLRTGQHLPHKRLCDGDDLAQSAHISASSRFELTRLPADGPRVRLENSWAQLLPMAAGQIPPISFWVDADEDTTLVLEMRASTRAGNFTPSVTLARVEVAIEAGRNRRVTLNCEQTLCSASYLFFCLLTNPKVLVHTSQLRISGLLSVSNRFDAKVATGAKQTATEDIGVDSFEFWTPVRRPEGHNLAFEIGHSWRPFEPDNVLSGVQRPTTQSNCWVASPHDEAPSLSLRWDAPQTIGRVELFFDPDYDHALETVLMGHPERAVPFCARSFCIVDAQNGVVLCEKPLNYQARTVFCLDTPVETNELRVEVRETWGAPAAIFEVRCYPPGVLGLDACL